MSNLGLSTVYLLGNLYLKLIGSPRKNYLKEYEKNINEYKKLYYSPLYWHGTGRFHYTINDKIIDVLESIIKSDGIKPLVKDPFLKTNNSYNYTISLANIRFYASVYALIHQYEKDNIEYIYGHRFVWSVLVGLCNLLSYPMDVLSHMFKFSLNKRTNVLLKNFQYKVRKQANTPNLHNFLLQLLFMPFLNSDIPGNYPILIAIKRNNIKFASLDSGFSYYEARTEQAIKLENFSHLEVPFNKISETQQLLKNHNVSIPVIPLELAEIFHKENFRIKELLSPPPKQLLITENQKLLNLINTFLHSILNLKPLFKGNIIYHDYDHAQRSYIIGCIILSKIQDIKNFKEVLLATFFHDIGNKNILNISNHNINSAKWIRNNLNKYFPTLSNESINIISVLCQQHSDDDNEDISLELKVIKDADALDRWRLPINKLNPKFLRLETSKEIAPIIKDFIKIWKSQSKYLDDKEKINKCLGLLGAITTQSKVL